MMDGAVRLALWAGALGSGLLAGVFFAFSAFVMAALAKLPPAQGIAAMQSINRVILGSSFMALFFGTPIAAAGLLVAAAAGWSPAAPWTTAAAALAMIIGMLGCTIAFNVPLNRRLDAAAPAEGAALWARYLRQWTRWNHLRTVASLAACGLFIRAIALQP